MRIILTSCLLFLIACSTGGKGPVRMMARDSGIIYVGEVIGDGVGTATMDITIDGERYTGIFVLTTTNERRGIIHQFGSEGSSVSTITTNGGTRILKGIFSSPSGRGLRCETTATGNGGSGICIDDKSRIFDITISRK